MGEWVKTDIVAMLAEDKRQKVLSILEETYGHTTTALEFKTEFQLLVATIMSAQSTDEQVNKITKPLFTDHPDAAAIAALPLPDLEDKIKRVGLYRNKAKNIHATARILLERYNGEVPRTREALEKLPGVGRKTANVVMSVAFGIPAIAVDTHVFRVSNRIGLADAKTERKTEDQLMANIPREQWAMAHHWLIWHGRKVCKAQRPQCDACRLKDYCQFYRSK